MPEWFGLVAFLMPLLALLITASSVRRVALASPRASRPAGAEGCRSVAAESHSATRRTTDAS